MSWYRHIPWDWVRSTHRSLRRKLFRTARPSGSYVLVEATEDELVRCFGKRSFAPNWEFSYHKKGEDLNLARVKHWEGHDHDTYERSLVEAILGRRGDPVPIVWWQDHVRGWNVGGDVWHLRSHWEPEPTESDVAHIEEVGFDVDRSMDTIRSILDDEGIAYETIVHS